MNSALLAAANLEKSFGGVKALNDVSFEVLDGEILALIGPNGAGKTSLFNCVNGVYKPEAGSIKFKNTELIGMASYKVANLGISRTFQNLALFNNLTVIDSLMLGRHTKMKSGIVSSALWLGKAKNEERKNRSRCADFVEILGLGPYASNLVGFLPYGIQKQIELGRALVSEPDLLLLDEPVSGLNSAETEQIGEILLRVKSELKLTMLIVEHDMSLVRNVADRVLAMNFGEIIADGSPQEISEHPRVLEAYLGIQDK